MKYIPILILIILIACQNKPTKKTELEAKNTELNTSFRDIEMHKIWETDTLLNTSESVIFDEKRNVLYVACINGVSPWVHDEDGFIARVDLEGKILDRKWVEGISAPKGMGIYEDNLYVANIDEVVRIDINTGEIRQRIPIEGGQNINDLTVAHDGDVFASDSKGSSIYKITNGEVSLLLNDPTLKGINGLYMMEDTLILASKNNGTVYRIQHGDLNLRKLVNLPSGGDGVEKYKEGFIISSWEGRIFFVDSEWTFTEKMNTTDIKVNSADIEVIENQDLLLVPTFFDNRVVAYKLSR